MGTGVDYSDMAPRVLLCGKPGVSREDMMFQAIVCDECYARYTSKR
jgi:hypothetical protein